MEHERAPYIASSLWYITYETFEQKYRVYPGNSGWYGPFDTLDEAVDHVTFGVRKEMEESIAKDRRHYRPIGEIQS